MLRTIEILIGAYLNKSYSFVRADPVQDRQPTHNQRAYALLSLSTTRSSQVSAPPTAHLERIELEGCELGFAKKTASSRKWVKRQRPGEGAKAN